MSAEWFLTDGGGGPAWTTTDVAAPAVAAGAPAGVSATPTGGTTLTVDWTVGSGGAPDVFDVELESPTGSGTWVAAVGAANPVLGTVFTFPATGLSVVTSYTPRVRAKKSGFADSAWTVGAAVTTDNSGTGGAVIGATDSTAPTLSGAIAITSLTPTSYVATCPPASDAVGVTGYQWRLGGTGSWTDIPSGGRVATFTGRTPASTDLLEMRARDAAGNFSPPLSTGVTLLGLAPAVTTQPSAVSAVAGNTTSFTVAFSGTPTPTLQWYKNGLAVPGATSGTYSFVADIGDTGAVFVCQATNGVGPVVSSNAAILTVTALASAPSITTQPASQTIAEGNPVTFSVVATGTAPLAYQWRKNGAAIAGATSASYTFTPTLLDSGASFSVVVSNGVGTPATSAAAGLVVQALLATTDLSAFSPFVLSRARGCPWPVAEHYVRQACIEWFERTLCWQVSASQFTQDGVRNYPLSLGAEVTAAKLLDAWIDGIQTPVASLDAGGVLSIGANDRMVWTNDRATINVNPLPGATASTVVLSLAVKPSQIATTIPTAQFEQYADQIADGALARLLRLPGKEWTDTDGAAYAKADFELQVGAVSARVAQGFSRATFRTQPNWF